MYRSVQFPDISYFVVKWIGTFWYKKLKKKLSIKVEKKSDAVCADWLESSTLLFLVAFTFLDQYFGRWYHTHIHTLVLLVEEEEEEAESFQTFLFFPRRASSFVVVLCRLENSKKISPLFLRSFMD